MPGDHPSEIKHQLDQISSRSDQVAPPIPDLVPFVNPRIPRISVIRLLVDLALGHIFSKVTRERTLREASRRFSGREDGLRQ